MPPRNTRQLWVEGKDDNAVVQSLCAFHDLPHLFELRVADGVENLMEVLPVQLRARGLERFGMVVDADSDLDARWTAVRDQLIAFGYGPVPSAPSPDGTVLWAEDRPAFGVWIMPDNVAPGMLEDFAAALVPSGDFLWSHAGRVIDAIPAEHRRFTDGHRPKAQIHTWLAWQEGPGSPMGQAITKGDLDANAPHARRFMEWLRRLMLEEVPADSGAG